MLGKGGGMTFCIHSEGALINHWKNYMRSQEACEGPVFPLFSEEATFKHFRMKVLCCSGASSGAAVSSDEGESRLSPSELRMR